MWVSGLVATTWKSPTTTRYRPIGEDASEIAARAGGAGGQWGYEAALLERLLAKQLPVALLNPRHVRQFARTSGRLAKTDAIDAAVLAHFAEVMKPEPRRIGDADTRRLRVLVARRSQLVQMVTAEQHRTEPFTSLAALGLCGDDSLLQEANREHR